MYLTFKGNLTKENLLHFQWRITNDCNKSCSYCFLNNDRKKSIWYEKNVKKIINELNNAQQKSLKEYELNIVGGEPLLHKDLIKYKNDIDIRYSIMSNLEFKFDYIKQFFGKKLNHFNTSIHFENNVERVLDNIKKIKDNGYGCNVNLMLENIISEDKIIDIYEKLKEIKCDAIYLKFIRNYSNEYYKNFKFDKLKKYLDILYNEEDKFKYSKKYILPKNIKTVNVVCDKGKYCVCIINGLYYYCVTYANYNFLGTEKYNENFFNKKIICKNWNCVECDFEFGNKKGFFKVV